MITILHRRLLLGAAALSSLAMAVPAMAADQGRQHYELAAQPLGDALNTISRQSGREIMFPSEELRGKTSRAISGDFTADEAVRRLLEGSGLTADYRQEVILIRGRSDAPESGSGPTDNPILVTGSRIRGATSPSPVITISQKQMLDAGQSNLGDVIRTLPQNFGGGQNPGIGLNVPVGRGNDLTGGTSLNLRGLGSDATLTLLNGHRLAYGSNQQSIDISTIPLAAVERLEIVADGASALYGSDAVGGVANIILKTDYDGVATTAQVGAATDGGYEQQHYNIVGGSSWATGGFLATYDFSRNTAILSQQRSYAAERAPGLDLYPKQRQHNVLISGHQALASGVTFAVDATFGRRYSTKSYIVSAAPGATRYTAPSWTHVFSLAPRLELALPAGWKASVQGLYGTDKGTVESLNTTSGVTARALRACVCNTSKAAEVSADGALFEIGGEAVKVAVGGGYRENHYVSRYLPASAGPNISQTQPAYYGFGELNVPLVSPAQQISGVYRLSISGAMRYEDYRDVGRVLTPKLGLIYAPSPDVDFKATWGKSFKAPTLYERYSARYAILYTAASHGGVGYPAAATVLFEQGSNPDLKPERASTWTASIVGHPHAIAGLSVEATYFNIRYKDRVVAPILYESQALTALYSEFVSLAPSDAAKAASLVGRDFYNNAGSAYNPANVVAIIHDSSVNAARQTIRGVDVTAQYRFSIGAAQSLTLAANGTYLKSDQKLTSSQPQLPMAGTLFYPPHFRGRGSGTWSNGTLTLSTFVNYTGSFDDTRLTPSAPIDRLVSVDFVVRMRIPRTSSVLSDMDITASIQNALNAKPGIIRTTGVYQPPYDSTNASPIGRFVSLAVTKHW